MNHNTYSHRLYGGSETFARHVSTARIVSILTVLVLILSMFSPGMAFAGTAGNIMANPALDIVQKTKRTIAHKKAPISAMEPFTLEKALDSHPFSTEGMAEARRLHEGIVAASVSSSAVKKVSYTETGAKGLSNDDGTAKVGGAEVKGAIPADGAVLVDSWTKVDTKAKTGKLVNAGLQVKSDNEVSKAGSELEQILEAAASEKADKVAKAEKRRIAYENSEQGKRDRLVEAALSRQGVPYVYGGTDPDCGMDCSGFTQWCYSQIGISIGRTSYDQEGCAPVIVDVDDALPGDILCEGGHVAIYIGDGQMIHEPQSGDVCRISSELGQFHCAARYI